MKSSLKYYLVLITVIFSACKKKSTQEEPDPLALIAYPAYFGEPQAEPIDNPTTVAGAQLGRFLFYDRMLSIDTTVSCASCHRPQNGFSDPNQFSVGVNGTTPRNSMSLTNLNWHQKFFWDGRAASLEEQALMPIQDPVEMGLTLAEAVNRVAGHPRYPSMFAAAFGSTEVTADKIAKAIAQFERTIISSKSKYDLYKQGLVDLTADELQGEKLFFTHPEPDLNIRGGNCGDCHVGALQRSATFRNNGSDPTHSDAGLEGVTGLDADKGKMKTVSLRNIALTAPYMHDGRFSTLTEVLDHYNEHVDFNDTRVDILIRGTSNQVNGQQLLLTEQEKNQIIAFLNTLTDASLATDPRFSNPFR